MLAKTKALRISVGLFAVIMAFAIPASAAKPDPWITTKAKIALLTDPDVGGLKINVDTIDGRVTLHGAVNSTAEKAEAERIVRGIDGVADVRNMLQIKPGAGATSSAKVDDDTLENRVKQAIDQDPALTDSDIEVASVDEGVVTLEGEARTMSEHRRALEKARAVGGVKAVKSQVKAPDEMRSDEVWSDAGQQAKDTASDAGDKTKGGAVGVSSAAKDMWITSATKVRLMANDKTPAMEINVDTHDSEVTLFGMVPDEQAKQAAESEARKVNGVVTVRNELEVVPKKMQEQIQGQDDELEEAINKKLDARPELKGDDVNVEVSNGMARLTGTVDSQSDRLSALSTARGVPGIRSAIDELKIDTSSHDGATANDRAGMEKQEQLERNRDRDAYDGDAQNDAGEAPLR